MTALESLLQGIVDYPNEDARWHVLADWLEEHEDPRRAELLRLHRRLLATCCEPDKQPDRLGWQARVVELLAEGVKPCIPQRSLELCEGVEMAFSFIPPGTFLMGRPEGETGEDDEVPQHRVTLTKGFFLGAHQVTQAQWQAVMGSNRSHFRGDNLPVTKVSWEDCKELRQKLGERDGNRYRLPTEAEWEYACRAGTTTAFFFGETISTDQANYDDRYPYFEDGTGVCRKTTTPVGSFPPNTWGLFNMHDNVCEWCSDWYGPYQKEDEQDPKGGIDGDTRVLRGGSWVDDLLGCRSGYRHRSRPSYRLDNGGCRVVLCLD
jgi:uncharacterized protein (TIGR02996 family)